MKVIAFIVLSVTHCVLAQPNSEYHGVERDQRSELAADFSQREGRANLDSYREGKANTLPVEPPKTYPARRSLLISPGYERVYLDNYGLYPVRRHYTPGDYLGYSYAAVGKFPYTRKGILSGSNYVYLENTL